MSSRDETLARLRADIAAIEHGPSSAAQGVFPSARQPSGTSAGGGATSASTSSTSTGEETASLSGDKMPGRDQACSQAYQKILRSVSVREQSSARMREKLARADFPQEVIDEALARAQRTHVIDDARYADALVRTTISQGKGLRLVLAEIESLGIDPLTLDSYQDYLEGGQDADIARARRALELHPPRAKNKREAAYRKLMSKGFSSDVSSSVARQWAEEVEGTGTRP